MSCMEMQYFKCRSKLDKQGYSEGNDLALYPKQHSSQDKCEHLFAWPQWTNGGFSLTNCVGNLTNSVEISALFTNMIWPINGNF